MHVYACTCVRAYLIYVCTNSSTCIPGTSTCQCGYQVHQTSPACSCIRGIRMAKVCHHRPETGQNNYWKLLFPHASQAILSCNHGSLTGCNGGPSAPVGALQGAVPGLGGAIFSADRPAYLGRYLYQYLGAGLLRTDPLPQLRHQSFQPPTLISTLPRCHSASSHTHHVTKFSSFHASPLRPSFTTKPSPSCLPLLSPNPGLHSHVFFSTPQSHGLLSFAPTTAATISAGPLITSPHQQPHYQATCSRPQPSPNPDSASAFSSSQPPGKKKSYARQTIARYHCISHAPSNHGAVHLYTLA